MAARLGIEPRLSESEELVLPLHHRAVKSCVSCAHGKWSRRWDSNPQPPVYKTGALPLSYAGETEGRLPKFDWEKTKKPPARHPDGRSMVAPRGLEPRTN